MAVQNDTSRIQYNGNNSTTNLYAIPFLFFENSHIRCVVTNSAGVDTELVLGNGFNVMGAGSTTGGFLSTSVAVPNTSKVTILRDVPATQTTSYQEGGDFPAASHERALDKLTMLAQQTNRLAAQSIRVGEGDGPRNDFTAGANTIIGMDVNKQPKAMTLSEVKSYLGLTGVTADVNMGVKTFADSGELAIAVPEFIGQLGTQRDTGAIYISTGTSAGNWTLFDISQTNIVPTSARQGRSLADMMTERVNVLDYGAIPGACAFTGSISGTTLTVTAISNVIYDGGGKPYLKKLAVGMIVDVQGVTPLTKITEILTGNGTVGTYRVSISQNVTSQAMEAFYDNRLPLQRAICGAKFPDSAEVVKNWTFDTMVTSSNGQPTPSHPVIGTDVRQFPALIFNAGPGGRQVYFPFGEYRISGPLYVSQGQSLYADTDVAVTIAPFREQQHNLIEDFYVWIQRQESGLDGTGQTVSWDSPWWIVSRAAFNAGLHIHGFRMESIGLPIGATPQLAWYQMPLYNETGYCLCTGTSGGTTITVTGNLIGLYQLRVGDKIRIKGFSAVYTVGSFNANTGSITLASGETLQNTFSNKILMLGIKAQSGIMCSGGENAIIEKCMIGNMLGSGVHVTTGSPGCTVRDIMVNSCDVAYDIDVGPCILFKPSGDANNTFIRGGLRGYCIITIIGIKLEEPRQLGGVPSPGRSPDVYADLANVRNVFDFGAGYYTIVGGGINAGANASGFISEGDTFDTPLISGWAGGFDPFPRISILGLSNANWGTKIFEGRHRDTGNYYRSIARTETQDGSDWTIQKVPNFEGNFVGPWTDNLASVRFRATRTSVDDTTWCGILVDQGSNKSNARNIGSGFRPGFATFTRSGTTVTMNYNAHGLDVGDYVQVTLNNVDVVANFTSLDTDGTTSFGNRVFRVMTVTTNSFTLQVANAGPTTGNAKLNACQYIVLHDIKNGVHRIQLPRITGSVGEFGRPALQIIDKYRRPVAGLRVFDEMQGRWWSSRYLEYGGEMNYAYGRMGTDEVTLTNLSGVAVNTQLIPAGVMVFGVTVRVTQAITGATSFNVGDNTVASGQGDPDRWGANIAVAQGTTTSGVNFTGTPFGFYPTTAAIYLNANGGNFTGGSVKVIVHYWSFNAPTL